MLREHIMEMSGFLLVAMLILLTQRSSIVNWNVTMMVHIFMNPQGKRPFISDLRGPCINYMGP